MPDGFNAAAYLLDRRLAAGDGDRLAVAGPAGQLTYAQLAERVGRVAAGLRGLDVRPEERVVLFTADSPDMLATVLAAMRMGAVAVPVNTMLTAGELAELLRDSRARVLVVSPEFTAAAGEAVAAAPELRHVLTVGGAELAAPAPVAVHALSDLAAHAGAASEAAYETWEDSPALWLYTSGTTGKSKGAMHRHANIRHVVDSYARQVLGITPEDRCFSVAKLFFAYGIGNSAFFPLAVGATTVLDPVRPTPATVAQRVRDDEPTLFFGVPTFYAALLAADLPADTFASVRLGVSAGEPLPAELFRRFRDRFGVEILDGIGSTEALHIFLSNRPGAIRPGTTGTAVPGYDLRVVDEATGSEVAAGQAGVLYVRGASTATGYWCRTDVTRKVFQGEWLRTGDTYVVDDGGYYHCLGRADDMIKAGGIWVSPAEVEERLLQHPAVAQAAVVGLPDAEGLDKPVACVVLEPGATVTGDELVEFCRAGLAAFKRPRDVLVVDRLPMTATGKLQRFAVRTIAADRLAARHPGGAVRSPVTA